MVLMLPTSLGVSLRMTGTSWATRVDNMSTRNAPETVEAVTMIIAMSRTWILAVLVTMPTMRAMVPPLEVQTVIDVPRMGLGLGPMVVVDVADGTLVLLPLAFAVSTESA